MVRTMNFRPESHRTMRRRATFVGLIGLSLILAACGSSHEAGAPTNASTITTSTTAASAAPSINDTVLSNYRAFWDDFIAVGTTTVDPRDPRLATHATGEELRQLQTTFLARRASDEVIKGSVQLAPTVLKVENDKAIVQDCQLDLTRYYSNRTGQPVDAQATTRFLIEASMQLENGTWKVASINHKSDGCAPTS